MQRTNNIAQSFISGRTFGAVIGVGLTVIGLGTASLQSANSQSGSGGNIPVPSTGIGSTPGSALSITNTGTGNGGYFLIQNTQGSGVVAVNTARGLGAHLAGPEAAVYGASGDSEGFLVGNYGAYGRKGQNVGFLGSSTGVGVFGEGTAYGVLASCGYGMAVEGDTAYGTAVRGFTYSPIGLAGDFVGRLRTTGFQLTNSPQAGYVLTSDASGNGTWQPASSSSASSGVQSLNSLTGTVQIVAGTGISITKHGNQIIISSTSNAASRQQIAVAVNGLYYIPAGYAYVDLVGGNGLATASLPPASSVPSGTSIIVSVSTSTPLYGPMRINIVNQSNQSVTNISSDGSYGPATVQLTSDGANIWTY